MTSILTEMAENSRKSQSSTLIKVEVLEAVKKQIKRKIKQFDISSLLKLLQRMGYKIQDITFTSNSTLASTCCVCEDIIFPETKEARLIMILNTGLLSSQTPLPNFFRKKMDVGKINPVLFTRFLSFFDHFVIRNLLALSTPDVVKVSYLPLIALNSPSSLAHLFQLCFPELKVDVIKHSKVLGTNNLSATLGNIYLGRNSFLGTSQELAVPTFKIVLTTEEINFEQISSWPLEVKRRVKSLLLSFLIKIETYITLILTIKRCKEKAYLGKRSYLGYSKIGEGVKAFNITLFSGYPKHDSFNPF